MKFFKNLQHIFDLFLADVSIFYLCFFGVYREYKIEHWAKIGLKK